MFKRDKNFEKESLVADFINIDWDSVLSVDEGDPIASCENFIEKTNSIIDTYIPLKKLSKKELKIQAKPWITSAIRKSIERRDKILSNFIKSKDDEHKEELYSRFKSLRNKIVSLTRASKKLHFQRYFTENSKNIKKTWSGIKYIKQRSPFIYVY